MADAERKMLEEELVRWNKQLAKCQAQLEGVAQGNAKYLRAREYWNGQQQITQIEAKLTAE